MDITAMKSIFLSFIALAILTNCSNENIKHADFIFSGSDIYTANESQDVVDTIAISKDKIIFVGEKKDSEKFKNEFTKEIKLDGEMILPGLHDVHIHLPGIVDSEFCDLNVIPYSLDELVPILKKCIKDAELEDGEWLSVTQWQYYSGNTPSGRIPHCELHSTTYPPIIQ
jgi:predicted amidohydrolase YtcJ